MRIALLATPEGEEYIADTADGFRRLTGRPTTFGALADSELRITEEPVTGRRLAPLRPGKIIAIGLNYLDHIRETGMERPVKPLIFTKFTTSIIGPEDPIVFDPAEVRRVDWEVELAAVVGSTARNVAVDDALGSIFGYTVGNDVSAREAQFADGQWIRGKSLDTFCPLGPVLVTADEVGDPQSLALGTRVNGEVMQQSNTSEMVFSVAELVAYCSRYFTLEPGDVVLTGTPWGCGEFMNPQRSLAPGDVVETWIDGIGILSNPVRAEVAG